MEGASRLRCCRSRGTSGGSQKPTGSCLERHPPRSPCRQRNTAETSGGPFGSLNEPVTPFRSLATDKSIYPRASLAFFKTALPRRTAQGVQDVPYSGFALDQDTGGAIRAPGRCDVYMGVGNEAADLAGRTQEEGLLYYLFLKPGGAAAGK